ncbi:response regulator [Paraburkholderia sp. LEh10]|jgi:FixJ family two-component response regulator|uniref:response regulator transcription factor n=1 Tax=Paraburkholderia sp. LEh10 TaxID=2821353 RepID=UPI001AE566DB|nr:response regulator [Paraburkholderia sp. LEh10]MBP0590770.1 response regulator [Paraburkholderia sp. LEh10]
MHSTSPYVAIVDDDASVCRAIRRLLLSIEIEADIFLSGEEFLSAWSNDPKRLPACVILDIHMPGMNGLEVQRQLSGSGISIIIMTAFDEIGVHQQALSSGAAGYLRKPFSESILLSTVKTALQEQTSSEK